MILILSIWSFFSAWMLWRYRRDLAVALQMLRGRTPGGDHHLGMPGRAPSTAIGVRLQEQLALLLQQHELSQGRTFRDVTHIPMSDYSNESMESRSDADVLHSVVSSALDGMCLITQPVLCAVSPLVDGGGWIIEKGDPAITNQLASIEHTFNGRDGSACFIDAPQTLRRYGVVSLLRFELELEQVSKMGSGPFLSPSKLDVGLNAPTSRVAPEASACASASDRAIRGAARSGFNNTFTKPLLGTHRAAVYFGYPEGRGPLAVEISRIGDMLRGLERDLPRMLRIVELSQKASVAERESRNKSELMTHLSHDVRTPLGNIRALFELLGGEMDDRESLVRAGIKSCQELSDLVESLLDFHAHQSGRLVARRAHIEVAPLVHDVIRSFEGNARLRGLALHFESAGEPVAFVDPRHLRRMISNLVSNAIKYTFKGAVRVVVGQDAGRCRISVIDSGVGLTDEQRKLLFEPFARFRRDMADGFGIGLAVTRALVEAQGGSLIVESEQGRGSSFSVDLPLVNEITQRYHKESVIIGAHVLLVDDDEDYLHGFKRLLEREGCRVSAVGTLEDAKSVCNFLLPDAVICDGTLPDGEGKLILGFLAGRAASVPALLVSGSDRISLEGWSAVLKKPASIGDVVSWLKGVIAPQPYSSAVRGG